MKVGDLVQATWSDGLVCSGRYVGTRRGYIILIDGDDSEIVCNKDSVSFRVLKRSEEQDIEKNNTCQSACPKEEHEAGR